MHNVMHYLIILWSELAQGLRMGPGDHRQEARHRAEQRPCRPYWHPYLDGPREIVQQSLHNQLSPRLPCPIQLNLQLNTIHSLPI